MVSPDKGDLGAKVFFIWGSTCAICFVYAIFLVYETKGLSLEQVDRMMEESIPLTSAKWKPTTTYASEMGLTEKGTLAPELVEDVERRGSAV
jgi:MFS transporter, SP family, sugar:H+ symporter